MTQKTPNAYVKLSIVDKQWLLNVLLQHKLWKLKNISLLFAPFCPRLSL